MGVVGGALLVAAFLPKWAAYGRNFDPMAVDYGAVRQAWEWSALSVALAVLGSCGIVASIVFPGRLMRTMLCVIGSSLLVVLLAVFGWANAYFLVRPRIGTWIAIGAGAVAAGWSWIGFSAERSREEGRRNGSSPANTHRLDLWGT
jgi:hypothetical protein